MLGRGISGNAETLDFTGFVGVFKRLKIKNRAGFCRHLQIVVKFIKLSTMRI